MERFDDTLQHPWKAYNCIHIAGTNGKGSVSSMIAVGLASEKKGSIGLYTSPHLKDFRERIKVIKDDGELHYEMIPKDDVMSFLIKYEKEIQHLSFFEITTGMALWWFKKIGVRAAVIEVGLGGRLDSTNIITPIISVICSIGLDHCAMLGGTREKIAKEKAGIIKEKVPVVIWGKDEETEQVFRNMALKTDSPIYFADDTRPPIINSDLKGEYQKNNIRTAFCVFNILGVKPNANAIENTAKISGLHGRWEILGESPLIIADIGHNPAALKYNFKQLESYGKRILVVYGIMKDKALNDIVPLFPTKAECFLCSPKGERALPCDELYIRLHELRPDLILHVCKSNGHTGSVSNAYSQALSAARPEDVIYVGGSNFVVAEI